MKFSKGFMHLIPFLLLYALLFGFVSCSAKRFTFFPGKDPSHSPDIEMPDKVVKGESFPVTITVGVGELHASTEKDHINWIALYKDDMEIGRVRLHTVHSMPKAIFTVALEKSTTLRAVVRANHPGTWTTSKKIVVQAP